jgi:PAS domain S-box-containing protein
MPSGEPSTMPPGEPTPGSPPGSPPERRAALLQASGWRLVLSLLGAQLLVLLVVWRSPPAHAFQGLASYAPLHVVLEMFSVAVSAMVFAVGWNASARAHRGNGAILACASLAVALFDVAHLLSYAGMPDFVTPSGPEKAIAFWLAARAVAALGMLAAVLRSWRAPLGRRAAAAWLWGALGVVALVLWVVLYRGAWLPRTRLPDSGLTPFKIGMEWAVIAVAAACAAIIARDARRLAASADAAALFGAAVATIFSEVCFSLYGDVTDTMNLLGHVYKVIAYGFLYQAVVVVGVRAPYARLAESEARFTRAMRGANDGLWDWDLMTDEVTYSPRWKGMLGYGPDELADHLSTWKSLVHPGDGARVLELVRAVAEGRQESFETEMRLRHKDGHWVHVLSRAYMELSAEGRPLRLTGTHVDVSARIEAEARIQELNADLERRVADRTAELSFANGALSRASRAKDEFLAGMSHELRTPLNAVLGLCEALQEGVYGPLGERQARTLGRVEEAGRHLLALITDILDLSKIQAGHLELEIGEVAVAEVCHASVRLVQEMATRKGQTIAVRVPAGAAPLAADARRLKQVLVNLLGNAVKFTPEGGALGLEASVEAERARFTVWDEGVGIAAADQRRLFDPFVQLDASLARQHGGTGLGLSLVRQLVELHGGTVSLESAPGKGSRFTVDLPAARRAAAPVASAAEPDGAAPVARAPRILLAEGDPVNAGTLCDFLEARGYAVTVADDGREALRLVLEAPPELLLVDAQMAVLDGLEVTRRIRAAGGPARALPIIVVTPLAGAGERELCLAAGADEHLEKPIGLRILAGMIDALLAARRIG